MRYRYRERRYCPGRDELIPLEPGDRWWTEGAVRFHLPAILIDIEEKPEQFAVGQLCPSDYAKEAATYVPAWDEEDDDDVTEPVVAVELGPDEWHIIDGWSRVIRALELRLDRIPAVMLPVDQAMGYVISEEDVRYYTKYWNHRVGYWLRRDRICGYILEDRPEYTVMDIDPEATWQAALEDAREQMVDVPNRWNRWFSIRTDRTKLWLGEPQYMSPACALVMERILRKKEFMAIFPLYEEWEYSVEEDPVREKARKHTVSYEYIFSIIRQYAREKKCDILPAARNSLTNQTEDLRVE